MKPFFVVLFTCMLACVACDTTTIFESPNYLRRYPGKLYLNSGRTFEGRLTIEPGRPLAPDVEVFEDGDRHPMRFRLDEVKGYAVRGRYYELKERKGGLAIGRNFSFMSRLTPDSARVHLYADYVFHKTPINGARTLISMWETELYLQLPGENPLEVYPLNGTRFTPSFAEKMSNLLADCPALAEKIKAKKEGYRLENSWRLRNVNTNVLMRIVNEYNQCGVQQR